VISTVEKTVATRFPNLRGKRVLVAASGGADSTALALVLKDLGCEIALAHVHHGIRGKSADADARFVAALARKLGAPFFRGKFDVPAAARKTGESLEMAARRVRRDFLAKTAKNHKFRFIATGHTADDQAETVLMRIARGTSITGLAGIPYATQYGGATFVRPLRDATRKQIVEFLKSRKQAWREDESNAEDFALRNRVRREILPLLEKRLNPSVRQALLRLADIAAAEDEVMSALAKKDKQPEKAPLAIRRRLALGELRKRGVPPEKQVFHSVDAPRRVPLCGIAECRAQADRRRVNARSIAPRSCAASEGALATDAAKIAKKFSIVWKNPGVFSTVWKNIFHSVENSRAAPKLDLRMGRGFSRRADEVCLSAAAVAGRDLMFRSWRAGDRMQPLGMTGSKKLSDIFTDLKVPRAERNTRIVVECGGEIAALAGWRVARAFAVEGPRAPSLRIRMVRIER
jgi:tRNA(Ile)-lysidine synthase